MITHSRTPAPIGLMLSGGLDSAILLAWLHERGEQVQPFYVSTGCIWESEERLALTRFLDAFGNSAVAPLVVFDMPVAELYGPHWSITGRDVPDETTPDEAVSLPGRNPLLLLKPLLWCGQRGIDRLAMATLAANPFPDATPEFFQQFGQALAATMDSTVKIVCPFAHKNKSELLSLASSLPLHLTFSCLAPNNGLHCGVCNKCAERRSVLQPLPTGDPTVYATVGAVT